MADQVKDTIFCYQCKKLDIGSIYNFRWFSQDFCNLKCLEKFNYQHQLDNIEFLFNEDPNYRFLCCICTKQKKLKTSVQRSCDNRLFCSAACASLAEKYPDQLLKFDERYKKLLAGLMFGNKRSNLGDSNTVTVRGAAPLLDIKGRTDKKSKKKMSF